MCASRLSLGTALAAVLATSAAAQVERAQFDRLSIEHGLSQSIVEAIVQDPKGFMWFATEDGLNRFDGYTFTVYRNVAGDPASLSHNEVKSALVDSSGALWLGIFEGGLNRLDPVTERFTRYRHDPGDASSLGGETVLALAEGPDGTVWIGTQSHGLDGFDPHTRRFTHYRHDPDDPASLAHDGVRALRASTDGSVWIGTGAGLDRLDPSSGRFTHYRHEPSDPSSLSPGTVQALAGDGAGGLWVGTDGGGLDHLDAATGRFSHHRHDPSAPSSLADDRVRALTRDHTGVVWVGTDGGGLDRFDPSTRTFTHSRVDPLDRSSLSADRVFSLYEDRSNVLWIGTYGGGLSCTEVGRERFHTLRHEPENPDSLGHDIVWSILEDDRGAVWLGTDAGGLDRWDPGTGRWRHWRHDPADPQSPGSDTIRIVFEDRTGVLWLATHGGGLDRFDPATGRFRHFRHDPDEPNSLAHDELRSVTQTRDGALWIGTHGRGLDRLDPGSGRFTHNRHNPAVPTSLSSDFVRAVLENPDGTMWVATQGGGLDLFDPVSGRFAHHRHDPSDPASLSNDYVFALHRDLRGRLWVGTYGGGLNLLDAATGAFRRFTSEDGLPSDSVYGILEDDDGRLWISTNHGLTCFDPERGGFRSYDVSDGLQSNEFNGGAFHRGRNGLLYFGGIAGFNYFHPEEIRGNLQAPAVVLTDLRLYNRSVRPGVAADGRRLLARAMPYTDELRLSHRDDVVTFEFAALHFAAPEHNRYAYRLEGLSSAWIPTDAGHRAATFTDLAPGAYVFRVKACNGDGVWNEIGTALRVVVTPPFWATWWFRLLALGALVGLAAAAHRARTRIVRMQTELGAAHDAQMAIMPAVAPEVEGLEVAGACLPASEVGGDFFDHFWLAGGDELCIAVGDVAGKAMPAAMTAVMASGMLCAHATDGRGVAAIASELGRSLHRKTPRRCFVALCLAIVRPDGRELELVNAGLCEPLLLRGGAAVPLASPAPHLPLGVGQEVDYASAHHALAPGDAVVIYSDGVPEALDAGGELYGYERLQALAAGLDARSLSAVEIRDAVLDDVARFAGRTRVRDDRTVVVVRVPVEP